MATQISGILTKQLDGTAEQQRIGFDKNLFAQIPCAVLNDVIVGRMSLCDLLVYSFVYMKQGEKQRIWWAVGNIAKTLAVDERSVQRSMVRLAELGHLKREGKTKHGTIFTTLLTKVVDGVVVLGTHWKEDLNPRSKKRKNKAKSRPHSNSDGDEPSF